MLKLILNVISYNYNGLKMCSQRFWSHLSKSLSDWWSCLTKNFSSPTKQTSSESVSSQVHRVGCLSAVKMYKKAYVVSYAHHQSTFMLSIIPKSSCPWFCMYNFFIFSIVPIGLPIFALVCANIQKWKSSISYCERLNTNVRLVSQEVRNLGINYPHSQGPLY